MSDLPVAARADTPVAQPASRLDAAKAFVGDLARPVSMVMIAVATSAAIMGPATAEKVGAAGLILAALYGAKAWETHGAAKAGAEVEIAKAQSGATP